MNTPSLPWSKEIEKALLCRIMTDPDSVEELVGLIRPEHFYSEQHKFIFSEILEMHRVNQPIDVPNLYEHLASQGLVEKAGGVMFIETITDLTNMSGNYHADAMLLKRYALLRALSHTGNSLMMRALEAIDEPEDIADETVRFIQKLADEFLAGRSIDSERDNAVSMCASLQTTSPLVALTGIRKLDEGLGGFRPSELIIIAAETGVGKTIFARQIRRESCKRGVHGLYCSGEMDGEQLSQREAAARTGIPLWKFRNPWTMVREDHNKAVDFAASECDKCSVLAGNLSLSRILAACSEARHAGTLGFCVIDYDELMDAPGGTDLEKLTTAVRGAKGISMSHKCPVILLSQLRKLQGQERADKPTLHRLFGTSAKVKDASTILFIDRPFVRELQGDETEAKIFVMKNRNGTTGELKCRFVVSRMRFSEEEETPIP